MTSNLQTVLRPGDVLCVRTGGFGGLMIRFGAAFRDKPNLVNHVAFMELIITTVAPGESGQAVFTF